MRKRSPKRLERLGDPLRLHDVDAGAENGHEATEVSAGAAACLARRRHSRISSLPEARIGTAGTDLPDFGNPQAGQAHFEQFLAQGGEVDAIGREQHEAFPFLFVRHAHDGQRRRPHRRRCRSSASTILFSRVRCGTISPAILEKRLMRPSMKRKPSSSSRPMSPVRYQPSLSTAVVWSVSLK